MTGLPSFGVEEQRVREAPDYDFTRSPRPSAQYCEQVVRPVRARDFCLRAERALHELGLSNMRRPFQTNGAIPSVRIALE
jgi:hypothetical protein